MQNFLQPTGLWSATRERRRRKSGSSRLSPIATYMDKIRAIRWTMIGLHFIVLIFGLVIGVLTTNLDLSEAMNQARADPALQRALLLATLVVGGNLVGAFLLLSPLFKSFLGICCLLAYEIAFLA